MKGKQKGKRTLKLSPRKRGNQTEREKFAIHQRLQMSQFRLEWAGVFQSDNQ